MSRLALRADASKTSIDAHLQPSRQPLSIVLDILILSHMQGKTVRELAKPPRANGPRVEAAVGVDLCSSASCYKWLKDEARG